MNPIFSVKNSLFLWDIPTLQPLAKRAIIQAFGETVEFSPSSSRLTITETKPVKNQSPDGQNRYWTRKIHFLWADARKQAIATIEAGATSTHPGRPRKSSYAIVSITVGLKRRGEKEEYVTFDINSEE